MLPIRSMVASKSHPVNAAPWKWARRSASANRAGWRARRCSAAPTRNPAVPHAGSTTVSSGVGAAISTSAAIRWRGVLNWPACPAVWSLPNVYS